MCNGDLLARKFRFQFSGPRSFPGRIEYEFLIFDSDVMNLLLKRLYFVFSYFYYYYCYYYRLECFNCQRLVGVAWGRRVLYRVS